MCSLLSLPSPSSPSILVFQAGGGRLGARMTAYSVLMVLRWEHNVTVLVDRSTMEYLDKVFDIQDPLPVLEDTLCASEMDKLSSQALSVWTEEEIMSKLTGHILMAFPQGSHQPDPAKFRTLWFPDKLLSSHSKQVRQAFTFHSRYLVEADRVLAELSNVTPEKEAVFVGVHARRTDYQQYSKQVQGVNSPGKSYYREAMDYYLEEYQDQNTMVWLVVMSDDYVWSEKNILIRPQTVWAGSDDPGRDMAVLARCNHSVMSQGNYGSWAAFLAGGDLYTQYGPVIK